MGGVMVMDLKVVTMVAGVGWQREEEEERWCCKLKKTAVWPPSTGVRRTCAALVAMAGMDVLV